MTVPPRILLVEDDPTSQDFLRTALRALPALVDAAGSVASAVTLALEHRYDLWLIDAHLPDGSGADLLARLRGQGATVPALAHSAAVDAQLTRVLRAQGFDGVIGKPLPAEQLRQQVAARLGLGLRDEPEPDAGEPGEHPDTPLPAWDDVAAARALNGQATHVAALRALFVAELPAAAADIACAARGGDSAQLSAQLHRLRASCGFTGAALLGEAVAFLHEHCDCEAALQRFEMAVETTLAQAGD